MPEPAVRRVLLALVFAAVLAVPAGAAVVYLKGGGQLEGQILRRTPSYVEVRTAGGPVRIPSAKIARIEYPSAAPAAPPGPAQPPVAPPDLSAHALRPAGPRQQFSIDFGLAAPVSRIDFSDIGGGTGNDGDVGPLIGFQYLYSLDPHWAAGIDFNYFHRATTDSYGLLPNSDSNVAGNDVVALALVKFDFLPQDRVQPYAAAGVGIARNSMTVDATPNPGFAWSDTGTDEPRRLVDGSAWAAAYSLRAGLDFLTYWSTVLSFELGWTHVASATYDATSSGRALGLGGVSAGVDAITVAGRWGWRF